MARSLGPLPPEAVCGAIPTRDLLEAGVGRRELAGPLWQRLGHGVRGWYDLDALEPDVRIQVTVAQQPPGTVIGGWAALHHHGVPMMDGRTGPGGQQVQPMLVHVGERGRSRPSTLLDVDRGRMVGTDVVEHNGVLVTTPTTACVAIARRYGAEEGLVSADASAGAGLTSRAALQEYVASRRRARSINRARLMAELVDGRSASPPESRFRYVWVVVAGLAVPLVNASVVAAFGVVVGKPDLLDLEAATVGEYDGEQHRALDHHTADNAREEAFEGMGLIVSRATSLDLWPGRDQLVQRLLRANARGLARDRSRDRWGWRP